MDQRIVTGVTPTTSLRNERNRTAMSTAEKLSLLTAEIKKHLGVQKTLNEIILQSGDSTIQMLIQSSVESLSTLENETEKLSISSVVADQNTQRTTPASTTTSEAFSPSISSSSRRSSKLKKKNKSNARKSVSLGDKSGNLCAICLDTVADVQSHALAEPIAVGGCGHTFHNSCLKGWLCVQKTCPTCRNTVPVGVI